MIISEKRYFKELTIVVAICSLLGLFAPLYWIFDLFNHFRPQAVVACLLLLMATCLLERKTIALVLIVLIFNLGMIGYALYCSHPILPLRESASVRIVSTNVLTSNRNYAAFLSLINRENPDVIVLTEINKAWVDNISPLNESYKYRHLSPREDNFGIGIYSKHSFDAKVINAGSAYDTPLIVADFEKFKIIGAHPLPPISEDYANDNKIYLTNLAREVQKSEVPVIVAGDLNATLWSSMTRPLFDAGLQSVNRHGVAYTWPIGMFPLALQIDHFFTKGIPAGNFKVLEDIGSDHFPIKAEIQIP